MTPPREPALFLEALLALRDPLSRIAMAISHAPASALPAAGRAQQIDLIQAALADADARIDDLASALSPRSSAAAEPSADCRFAFEQVCRRAALAARARGVVLEANAGREPIPGDASLVRRATLRVLRATFEWAGRSGRLQLELAALESGALLRCSGAREGAPARAAHSRDSLARFALAAGARAHGLDGFAGEALCLRVELPAARCPA